MSTGPVAGTPGTPSSATAASAPAPAPAPAPASGSAGRPVTSSTRVIALLGDPVSHSRSPDMQNAAFRHAGVDGVYVSIRCRTDDVGSLLRTLAFTGGGGNVTLPHKGRAATLIDAPSDAVLRTGACNTFWGEGDVVHGDNTDVEGFRRALRLFLEEEARAVSIAGARVLLLGAGGAARAVLVALLDDAVGCVTLLNRSVERARAAARRIGRESVTVADGVEKLKGERFDLVVNATRLGLGPDDPLPFDLDVVERTGAVFDLVYGDRPTPFVRAARERGIPAADGAEMLVQQGAVAFERWWGTPAPVDAMRAALEAGE